MRISHAGLILAVGLALAGCQRLNYGSRSELPSQPAPLTPAPVGGVQQSQLPPPGASRQRRLRVPRRPRRRGRRERAAEDGEPRQRQRAGDQAGIDDRPLDGHDIGFGLRPVPVDDQVDRRLPRGHPQLLRHGGQHLGLGRQGERRSSCPTMSATRSPPSSSPATSTIRDRRHPASRSRSAAELHRAALRRPPSSNRYPRRWRSPTTSTSRCATKRSSPPAASRTTRSRGGLPAGSTVCSRRCAASESPPSPARSAGCSPGRPSGRQPIKGLYVHGPVGRGKTMLMDIFFDLVPAKRKRRAHFNDFMADVHERIHAYRQKVKAGEVRDSDPIPPVAADLVEIGLGALLRRVLRHRHHRCHDPVAPLFGALPPRLRARRDVERRARTTSIATGSIAASSCPSSIFSRSTPTSSASTRAPTTGWKRSRACRSISRRSASRRRPAWTRRGGR